jgi:2'-5' RNA ligase
VSALIRSFIAVPLPPEVKERLAEAQRRLRPVAPEVKWVAMDSFHITLKFLGGVAPDQLQQTWQEVTGGLRGAAGFTLHLVGAGAFPSAARPRVIWAGIAQGAEELARLAARTERACAACGFDPENRPFRSHVTLGRVREPAPNPQLAEQLVALATTDFGMVPVDRVILMKSDLTPQGARYTALEQLLLESSTGPG